jgi:hypothetical protein
MNNKYTLKELAEIGLNAACQFEPNSNFPLSFQNYREAFAKAILDTIGYELPKDEEREAFERWYECAPTFGQKKEVIFAAWKAGREELRKAMPMFSFDKNITITTEPAWIPWHGGSNPIVGEQTKYEIEIRNGERFTCAANDLRWSHDGSIGDIIAYRILWP